MLSYVMDNALRDNDGIVEAGITRVCYNKTITHVTGMWKAENPLLSTLPLFFTQLGLIMFICHFLKLLLAPLHQPRIVAYTIVRQIVIHWHACMHIAGWHNFGSIFYPENPVLSQIPISSQKHVGDRDNGQLGVDLLHVSPRLRDRFQANFAGQKKSLEHCHRWNSSSPPSWLSPPQNPNTQLPPLKATTYGPFFWGTTLATTNFSELALVLADAKLLHSDVGRTALSVSVINDLVSWVLLLMTVAIVSDGKLYTVLSTFTLIIFCVYGLRPVLPWMVCNTRFFNEKYDMDNQICFIMAGVLLFGFISDAFGSHSILGAFMFGAILPKGELKTVITEKVEDFVSKVLLPLFFLILGMRTHVDVVFHSASLLIVMSIVVLAFLAKFVVSSVAAIVNKMPVRDSLAFGLVMNAKGLFATIILNSGRDLHVSLFIKVLDHNTFSVMILAIVIMTAAVGPILALIYKSNGPSKQHTHRSIRSIQPNSDNVSSVINLLEISNPTKQSPMFVFAVHLVELSGHASAMLIVHDTCSNIRNTAEITAKNQKHSSPSNQIVAAFEKLETESEEGSLSVETLTAVSSYTSMHEDICNLADDKSVNKNLLENASCSVAIFVDRGLTDPSNIKNDDGHGCCRCAMLFIGGPDDREALAYAWRMASNPGPNPNISLTVVRFIIGKDASVDSDLRPNNPNNDHDDHEDEDKNILGVIEENEKEKQLDDQYIESFVFNTRNQPSIRLINEVVNNVEETLN
ncbi:cation/hydrogen exchanger 15 [Prunus dulcis]|uniref:Cation/hydrogen exchanger 15 n=1 Tax=Prunus dulcis TaxID=3755 RepID=A0A4Y1RE60_PRUDU|nr:cation/hydrogen exchanger 15 [Prunus dulcis]